MTAQHDTGTACDAALDYLYDMLSGEQKVAFETHLATCARCQAELEAFGRVRTVAKEVLPHVEPSDRLAGALHAQLMHAATKQAAENKGGKILPFVRRFVQHPGYAVAASLLLVGGVVGWQLSRGSLLMAPKQSESATVTVAAPAAAPVTTTPTEEKPAPSGAPAVPEPEIPASAVTPGEAAERKAKLDPEPALKLAEGAKGKLSSLEVDGLAKDRPKAELTYSERYKTVPSLDEREQRVEKAPSPAKKTVAAEPDESMSGASRGGSALSRNVGPAPMAGKIGQGQAVGGNDDVVTPRAATSASSKSDSSRNDVGGGGAAQRREAPAAKPAPAAVAPMTAQPAPAPPPAQPMTTSDGEPGYAKRATQHSANNKEERDEDRAAGEASTDSEERGRAFAKNAASPAPRQNAVPQDKAAADEKKDAVDEDRSRANSLAQAGRCDEATLVFGSLEKRAPSRLSAQDRLTYTRCLRTLGRLEPAQNELNQLRAQKRALPAPTLDAEQEAINLDRKRNSSMSAGKRAKAKSAAGAADAYEAPPRPADANTNKQ